MRDYQPFTSDQEIIALAGGFIDLSLPKTSWTHAAHFATTLWMISCRSDLDPAREMPRLIRRYNEAMGGVNSDTAGYHETITQASIRAARDFLRRHPAALHVACNALLKSPLGDPDWLLTYWSRPCLFSVAARRAWVEPDIQPLPY